ncbi:MAG: hypothetical protein VXW43_19610 [Pseudomonadota bacterium]|nr:hypothetical protein [Pseudomonadota bacterium]
MDNVLDGGRALPAGAPPPARGAALNGLSYAEQLELALRRLQEGVVPSASSAATTRP